MRYWPHLEISNQSKFYAEDHRNCSKLENSLRAIQQVKRSSISSEPEWRLKLFRKKQLDDKYIGPVRR